MFNIIKFRILVCISIRSVPLIDWPSQSIRMDHKKIPEKIPSKINLFWFYPSLRIAESINHSDCACFTSRSRLVGLVCYTESSSIQKTEQNRKSGVSLPIRFILFASNTTTIIHNIQKEQKPISNRNKTQFHDITNSFPIHNLWFIMCFMKN